MELRFVLLAASVSVAYALLQPQLNTNARIDCEHFERCDGCVAKDDLGGPQLRLFSRIFTLTRHDNQRKFRQSWRRGHSARHSWRWRAKRRCFRWPWAPQRAGGRWRSWPCRPAAQAA
eukprot:scaffold1436_cov250-Pinguiococcus_pyrenoidosus.AAC.5